MRTTLALAVGLLLGACSSTHTGVDDGGSSGSDAGGASDFAGAYIGRDCAPDDGLAYRILLWDVAVPECSADPARRSLSFYIFSGTDVIFPLADGSVVTSTTSSGGFGNGSATLCPGGTPPCLTSQEFTLRFDRFTDMSGASGTYTIMFETGPQTGRFDASWCEGFGPPMCG